MVYQILKFFYQISQCLKGSNLNIFLIQDLCNFQVLSPRALKSINIQYSKIQYSKDQYSAEQ